MDSLRDSAAAMGWDVNLKPWSTTRQKMNRNSRTGTARRGFTPVVGRPAAAGVPLAGTAAAEVETALSGPTPDARSGVYSG
ncbi:hypothetical protein GCM10009859_09130 [Kocuria salsicia]